MKYAYYPGCSLHTGAKEYEKSTLYVCKELGIEFEEIPDWNCCGASSAHSTSHLLGVAVPARNLLIAEKQGLDVVVPCAACYQRLIAVNYEMKNDPHIKENLNKVLPTEYKGETQVLSILEIYDKAEIAKRIQKPLEGLKVASYYGCYYVKPRKLVSVDDSEDPRSMDEIMEAAGATAVDWSFKTECCANSLAFHNRDVVLNQSRSILQVAKDAGADCIVAACPMCQMNLDMRQSQINKRFQTDFDIPVFYFTELLAIAMGASGSELGVDKHFVDTAKVVNSL